MLETAYAKINLALHVRRRRDDGYHDLETLFAFVDDGDRLTASAASQDVLHVMGEFAEGLVNTPGNMVLRALEALPYGPGWSVVLEKRLPVAAGLGGGSADAAAIFRMAEQWGGLPKDWCERAGALGADVPACIRSEPCLGRGTGTHLEPVGNDLRGMPVLLVNPRKPLATGAVFAGWDGVDRGPMPLGTMRHIVREGRNDLEASAIALCPAIARILEALRRTGPLAARMSGSGASCFALYQRKDVLDEARQCIAADHPGWWTLAGTLR